MISKVEISEFKAILLKDYGFTADDKVVTQIANDFLISLEAVLLSPKVDNTPRKEAK